MTQPHDNGFDTAQTNESSSTASAPEDFSRSEYFVKAMAIANRNLTLRDLGLTLSDLGHDGISISELERLEDLSLVVSTTADDQLTSIGFPAVLELDSIYESLDIIYDLTDNRAFIAILLHHIIKTLHDENIPLKSVLSSELCEEIGRNSIRGCRIGTIETQSISAELRRFFDCL